MRKFSVALLLTLSLTLTAVVPAFETDQFNLPPVPLNDVGDEVSNHLSEGLMTAAAKLNGQIALHEKCASAAPRTLANCSSLEQERKTLASLRSPETFAKAVFEELGDGNLFVTRFGKWIRSHRFASEPSTYKPPFRESIFKANPIDQATLSPTVRLYGSEFGTDKLEHFLQQGYNYYSIRQQSIANSRSEVKADKDAIDWGRRTERTYFGTLASGVYSNADLFANFAGMRFYQRLTGPVKIDGKQLEPVAAIENGRWTLKRSALGPDLLKPFISDHLNEAYNRSGYSLHIALFARLSVKKYACAEWLHAYPQLYASAISTRSKQLETWGGEDYGFTDRGRTVSIADLCYAND